MGDAQRDIKPAALFLGCAVFGLALSLAFCLFSTAFGVREAIGQVAKVEHGVGAGGNAVGHDEGDVGDTLTRCARLRHSGSQAQLAHSDFLALGRPSHGGVGFGIALFTQADDHVPEDGALLGALDHALLQEVGRQGFELLIAEGFFAIGGHKAPAHRAGFICGVDEVEGVDAKVGGIGIAGRRVVGGDICALRVAAFEGCQKGLQFGGVWLARGGGGYFGGLLGGKDLWRGKAEHRRIHHGHVVQPAAGQLKLQGHAARGFGRVGHFGVAARNGEAGDDGHGLA